LLSVPIAQPDNLLMDTLVSNAQLDKLWVSTTLRHATLQLVLVTNKLELLSIISAAVLVRLANGQYTKSMLQELNVFLDH
jgi:hypothetical protein